MGRGGRRGKPPPTPIRCRAIKPKGICRKNSRYSRTLQRRGAGHPFPRAAVETSEGISRGGKPPPTPPSTSIRRQSSLCAVKSEGISRGGKPPPTPPSTSIRRQSSPCELWSAFLFRVRLLKYSGPPFKK